MTAFFSPWDYSVYLNAKLSDVYLTRTNTGKITTDPPKCSICLRRAFSSHCVSQRNLIFSCTTQPWSYSTQHTESPILLRCPPMQQATLENNIVKAGLYKTNWSGTTLTIKLHLLAPSFLMHPI